MNRNIALDSLRGLMLVLVTFDHLDNPLSEYTYEVFGFVSVASGFVFLSGIVAGLVYTKYLFADRTLLNKKSLLRSLEIFTYHVISIIIVFKIASSFIKPDVDMIDYSLMEYQFPVNLVLIIFSTLNRSAILDILPMYMIFVLLIPFVIQQFEHHSGIHVLIISVGLWFMERYDVSKIILKPLLLDPSVVVGHYSIFAWQLLFISGLWFGYQSIKKPHLNFLFGTKINFLILSLAILLFLAKHLNGTFFFLDISHAATKYTIGWLRLFNFALLAYLFYWIYLSNETILKNKWLALVGKYSIQVFTFHIFFLYIIKATPLGTYIRDLGSIFEVLVSVAIVMLLILIAFFKDYLQSTQYCQRQRVLESLGV